MPNALTMRLPVMVSCRMFWISASLSCPPRVVLRTCRPIFLDETDHGQKSSSTTQPSSQPNYYRGNKYECKKLLQEFRQHARHRVLHLLNIVDDGREQGAGGVLGEKGSRATKDGVIEIVAQVGDHSEPGVVDENSSDVIEDAFQHRGGHEGESDHGPRIVKVRGNQLLEIENTLAAREPE